MFINFREGEREKHQLVVSDAPQQGTEPATQACALTGKQTHNILVHRTMPQPTEPRWPGLFLSLLPLFMQ